MADFLKYAESVLKILAILAAGTWAIYTFIRKREWYPKAKLNHKFTVIEIDENRRVLRIELVVENTGEKILRLRRLETRLQQVTPLATTEGGVFDPRQTSSANPEVEWPTLSERNVGFAHGECEVEPGESHTLQFDYVVSSELHSVQAYSYIANQAKWLPPWKRDGIRPKEIGWLATDIFAFPPKTHVAPSSDESHRRFDQSDSRKPEFIVIPDGV